MRKWLALLFLVCVPAWGVQTAYPISDITDNCSGTYADVDEAGGADAADETCSYTLGECASTDVSERWGITSLTDPLSSTGHTIKAVCNTIVGFPSASVSLWQATVYVAGASIPCSGTEQSYTLNATEANAITDYTTLRLQFTISGADGGCECLEGCYDEADLEYIRFEVPDAGGGAATRRIFIIE